MKNYDEALVALLRAKENIALYSKEKGKNKNLNLFYDGIIEKLDNIITDYTITTKMDCEEIMNCYFEVGADNKDSIFYDEYITMKINL